MKINPLFFIVFLLSSCVYDPPLKGKEISIHNQTNTPILLIDSLTGGYFKLYDTATVNNRRYITRSGNFLTEYGNLIDFYSEQKMKALKLSKKNITVYLVKQDHLRYPPDSVFANKLYRSFELNLDTFKKYELNHLFITTDTVLFEHDFNYQTDWRNTRQGVGNEQ